MSKHHWLKNCNKNKLWVDEIPFQKVDPCVAMHNVALTLSIRPSVLRMSSRTHNEFGIQFLPKRLPNLETFAIKAGFISQTQ